MRSTMSSLTLFFMPRLRGKKRASDLAVEADHDAEEHRRLEIHRTDEDGRHRLVGGLEPNVVALRVVVLHRGFVADERDHDIAARRSELLANEDVIAAEDARVDHGVAVDLETEHVAAAAHEAAV